jgi:hypothetical protein
MALLIGSSSAHASKEPTVDPEAELPELSDAQLLRLRNAMAELQQPNSELALLRARSDLEKVLSEGRELWLSPDGRYADLRFADWEQDSQAAGSQPLEPYSGEFGRYRWDGDWLVLSVSSWLQNLPDIDDDMLRMGVAATLESLPAGSDVDDAISQIESFLAEETAEMAANGLQAEDGEPQLRRLLKLSHAAGYVLISEDDLTDVAQRWTGEGPLWLTYGVMWSENLRPGLSLRAGLHGEGFAIDSPLSAATPEPLRKLLRPEPIEVRVVAAADDPAEREWSWGSAEARYRLDKGSVAGLFVGMSLYPQDLGDSPYLRVEEVAPDHAIARGHLSRFAPTDAPLEPRQGQAYVTRHLGARQSCGIDTSAAVRAKITAVRPLHEGEADEEGFLWFEVDIDHGSRAGLELEQSLSLEGAEYVAGEARVRALRADSATLLWRMHAAVSQGETEGPRPEAHAVTRAWQRAAEEVFGR